MAEGLTDERAEAARIRYEYRKLIVSGKKRIPLSAATGLVGPDCAYHLYRARGKSATAGTSSTADVTGKRIAVGSGRTGRASEAEGDREKPIG